MKKEKSANLPDINFINQLLSYLHEGFQNPVEIINYLKSKGKCSENECKNGCDYFSSNKLWNMLSEFFEWCWRWYPHEYEVPINAFFTIPRIVQFLELCMGWDETIILQNFKFEFKGLPKPREIPIPPCLFISDRSMYITKKFFNNHRGSADIIDHGLACDFFFKHPLPPVVFEIKVYAPQKRQSVDQVFVEFNKDLDKCKKWISHPAVRINFGFRFEYALAILIDLSGKPEIKKKWENIYKEELIEKGIYARLISPFY